MLDASVGVSKVFVLSTDQLRLTPAPQQWRHLKIHPPDPLKDGRPVLCQRLCSHGPAPTHRRSPYGPFSGERWRAPHSLEEMAAHLQELLGDGQCGMPDCSSLLPTVEESLPPDDAWH